MGRVLFGASVDPELAGNWALNGIPEDVQRGFAMAPVRLHPVRFVAAQRAMPVLRRNMSANALQPARALVGGGRIELPTFRV